MNVFDFIYCFFIIFRLVEHYGRRMKIKLIETLYNEMKNVVMINVIKLLSFFVAFSFINFQNYNYNIIAIVKTKLRARKRIYALIWQLLITKLKIIYCFKTGVNCNLQNVLFSHENSKKILTNIFFFPFLILFNTRNIWVGLEHHSALQGWFYETYFLVLCWWMVACSASSRYVRFVRFYSWLHM